MAKTQQPIIYNAYKVYDPGWGGECKIGSALMTYNAHKGSNSLVGLTWMYKSVVAKADNIFCQQDITNGMGMWNAQDNSGNEIGIPTFITGWFDHYAHITPSVAPVIIYLDVRQIKNLGINSGYFYDISLPDTAITPVTTTTAQTWQDFVSMYGEKYIVYAMNIYSNNLDGSYSQTNKRPLYGNVGDYGDSGTSVCDVLLDFYCPNAGSAGVADVDIVFPALQIINSNKSLAHGVYGNISNVGAFKQLYNGDVVFRHKQSTNVSLGTSVSGGSSSSNYKMFSSLDQITTLINELHIPFTYDVNKALSGNTSTFTDGYNPSGQASDPTGGGAGTGDNTSDPITETDPDITCIGSFNKHYAVTQNMLGELSDYLWSSTFFSDIKLLFNSPSECLVSCRMFPFNISGHDGSHVGGSEAIQLGNVTATASGYPIHSGYNCRFDLGSITIQEYFGSCLDYDPYTSIQIYLPYIGIKDLSTTEVMNHTIYVSYIVDITTGTCISRIFVEDRLLYTYDGKIGVEIPLNSSNSAQLASSLLTTGASAVGGLIAGAMSGPLAPVAVGGTILATAKGVAGSQFHVTKGGSNSPFAGFYMPQYCYLIISRPIQSLSSNFKNEHGFPSNVSRTLSDVTGYTECEKPILTGISATDDEKAQIINLLETGVIIT